MQPPALTRELAQRRGQKGFIRLVILIGVGLIVLLSIVSIHEVSVAHQEVSIPEIRSGISGYCLDDHHDGSAPNAVVDSWVCNGMPAQDWTISGNTVRHDKSCLAIQSNSTAQNSKVVLNPCNGQAGQEWSVDLGGLENLKSGLCLAIPGKAVNKQLVVASCSNLSKLDRTWSADTWNNNGNVSLVCNGTEGQKVACYAQKQWLAWESGSPSHQTLLTDYTDGNSYEEWCADFISYVYREAGYPFTDGERGGWDEYDANTIQYMGFTVHEASAYVPKPGDVAFFDYPGGHAEIVIKGGDHPTFIYGDSGTVDPATNNGEMNEDTLTNDGPTGQVTYYLSPALRD